MELQEPSFYAALRAVMASGSGKAREVRLGRFVADARTLVRDRDALAGEIAELRAENTRLRSVIAKLDADGGTSAASPDVPAESLISRLLPWADDPDALAPF